MEWRDWGYFILVIQMFEEVILKQSRVTKKKKNTTCHGNLEDYLSEKEQLTQKPTGRKESLHNSRVLGLEKLCVLIFNVEFFHLSVLLLLLMF